MGQQQKLKALRRAARVEMQKEKEQETLERKKLQETTEQKPPDLGVVAAEVVQTADKFGG